MRTQQGCEMKRSEADGRQFPPVLPNSGVGLPLPFPHFSPQSALRIRSKKSLKNALPVFPGGIEENL
jgi:hypothetical protein